MWRWSLCARVLWYKMKGSRPGWTRLEGPPARRVTCNLCFAVPERATSSLVNLKRRFRSPEERSPSLFHWLILSLTSTLFTNSQIFKCVTFRHLVLFSFSSKNLKSGWSNRSRNRIFFWFIIFILYVRDKIFNKKSDSDYTARISSLAVFNIIFINGFSHKSQITKRDGHREGKIYKKSLRKRDLFSSRHLRVITFFRFSSIVGRSTNRKLR